MKQKGRAEQSSRQNKASGGTKILTELEILKNVLALQKYVWKFAPELFFIRSIKLGCQLTSNVLVYEFMVKKVLDAITQNRDFKSVVSYILWVGLWMFSFDLINNIYNNYVEKNARLKIHRGVHDIIFEKVQKVDLEKYDNTVFYNDYIWTLDKADTEILNSFNNLFEFLFDCGHALALLGVTFLYDRFLLAFVVVPLLLYVLLGNHRSRLEYEYEQEDNVLRRKGEYSRRIFYLKDYAKELKLYPVGNILRRDFRESVDAQRELVKKYRFSFLWIGMAGDSLSSLFNYVLLYIYLAYRAIVQQAYTAGTCAALVNAVGNMSYALGNVFKRIPKIRKNGMFAEKILGIMTYRGTVESYVSDEALPAFRTLAFRNVSFRYPGSENDSISKINLSLKKGEKLAIVGRNGSGKTTLVKLLMRYYDVTKGGVYYNETDIRKYTTTDYRKLFSTIFQDFQIYAIRVGENICMDTGTENRERMLQALTDSGLAGLCGCLSARMTREFDEKGLVLSGGQRQKLAIARALYRNADIVIMDEASSALDPIAEAEINHTVMEQMRDKTMIIISHRLSTIKHMDRICFMEQGRILETGTHEELMALNGKYAEMYRVQAESYRI